MRNLGSIIPLHSTFVGGDVLSAVIDMRSHIEALLTIMHADAPDSSGGLGPNLVVNGGFATDTDWTKDTAWTIASGVAHAGNGTAGMAIKQLGVLTTGKTYRYNFDVLNYVTGGIRASAH